MKSVGLVFFLCFLAVDGELASISTAMTSTSKIDIPESTTKLVVNIWVPAMFIAILVFGAIANFLREPRQELKASAHQQQMEQRSEELFSPSHRKSEVFRENIGEIFKIVRDQALVTLPLDLVLIALQNTLQHVMQPIYAELIVNSGIGLIMRILLLRVSTRTFLSKSAFGSVLTRYIGSDFAISAVMGGLTLAIMYWSGQSKTSANPYPLWKISAIHIGLMFVAVIVEALLEVSYVLRPNRDPKIRMGLVIGMYSIAAVCFAFAIFSSVANGLDSESYFSQLDEMGHGFKWATAAVALISLGFLIVHFYRNRKSLGEMGAPTLAMELMPKTKSPTPSRGQMFFAKQQLPRAKTMDPRLHPISERAVVDHDLPGWELKPRSQSARVLNSRSLTTETQLKRGQ